MIRKIKHYIRWRYDLHFHWKTVAKQLPMGGRVAEIGTWKGASAIRWLKHNPSALFCIDPYRIKNDNSWEGSLTQYELDDIYDKAYNKVENANKHGCYTNFILEDSLTAVKYFKVSRFDCVYIDGDHSYQACLDDLNAWWPKIKPGGSIIIDDHISNRWWGNDVINAAKDFKPVNEETRFTAGRWLIIKKELK